MQSVSVAIKSHQDRAYTASGKLIREVGYDGSGSDASWLTSDDVIDHYRTITYDTAGNVLRTTDATGPGPDGAWFTADDAIDTWTMNHYSASGNLVRSITYDDPGTDTVWFTSDDRIRSSTEFSLNSDGSTSRETRYYDPGPDNTWFTSDDRIASSTRYSYDTHGNLISKIRYDQPGPASAWLSATDRVGAIVAYAFDADNRRTVEIRYYDTGADGVWSTADDAILSVATFSYDASGKLLRQDEYDGPGPDNTWQTADDTLSSFTTFDYNADATLARETWHRRIVQTRDALTVPSPEIGVFYYPGWSSTFNWWNDIQGLPGSRSPGIPWPDRVPLLGYYLEEQTAVADKHIEWASRYGITFFAYDWYWDGSRPQYDDALQSHLRSGNASKLKFTLLWANHFDTPRSLIDFDAMVAYWIAQYFNQPNLYTIDGKPAIFIFTHDQLDKNALAFGETARSLLARADRTAQAAGFKGIYFIATTNAQPSSGLEAYCLAEGYQAYTGWNYVASLDASLIADYRSMVDTYLNFYNAAAATNATLPYIATVSPGWDDRPWQGSASSAYVRENNTPEKFKKMLLGARSYLESTSTGPNILMIEAWNEFGEGAYLEPTRKWGMQYLEAVKSVFGAKAP